MPLQADFLEYIFWKVDAEAERQGEMLAFYGEEETRNYGSPDPGPALEKDDAAVKPTDPPEVKVRSQGLLLKARSLGGGRGVCFPTYSTCRILHCACNYTYLLCE